jgi:hypothetical protein
MPTIVSWFNKEWVQKKSSLTTGAHIRLSNFGTQNRNVARIDRRNAKFNGMEGIIICREEYTGHGRAQDHHIIQLLNVYDRSLFEHLTADHAERIRLLNEFDYKGEQGEEIMVAAL